MSLYENFSYMCCLYQPNGKSMPFSSNTASKNYVKHGSLLQNFTDFYCCLKILELIYFFEV